jgi:hypothetical protein
VTVVAAAPRFDGIALTAHAYGTAWVVALPLAVAGDAARSSNT